MENLIIANKELNAWCGTKNINFYDSDSALGFLFKYAVPKLQDKLTLLYITLDAPYDETEGWFCEITPDYPEITRATGSNKNPALALFWAIWKVIHE